MRGHIFCGADDAKPFHGAPEREAVPLGKLDKAWNVSTIRGQTAEPLKRQNDLFDTSVTFITRSKISGDMGGVRAKGAKRL